jgi:hypothetical protein
LEHLANLRILLIISIDYPWYLQQAGHIVGNIVVLYERYERKGGMIRHAEDVTS